MSAPSIKHIFSPLCRHYICRRGWWMNKYPIHGLNYYIPPSHPPYILTHSRQFPSPFSLHPSAASFIFNPETCLMCDADGHATQLKRDGLDRLIQGTEGRNALYSAGEVDSGGSKIPAKNSGTARGASNSVNKPKAIHVEPFPVFPLRLNLIPSPWSSAHPLVCLSRMERSYISVLHHSTISLRHLIETLNGNWHGIAHNCQEFAHVCVWEERCHKYGHVHDSFESRE